MSAPPYRLCDLGLHPEEAKKAHEPYGTEAWRGEEFQTGRAPFASKSCAVWRAMSESFAPVERALSPAFHLLLHSRGARLRGEAVPDFQAAYKLALDSVSQTIDLGGVPGGTRARPSCVRGRYFRARRRDDCQPR